MSEDKVFIGRAPSNQIQLKDPRVSNCHALICISNDHLVIKDLQSTNGTLVNQHSIEEIKLYIGDEITVGSTTIQLISQHMTSDETAIHTIKHAQKTIIANISLSHKDTSKDNDHISKNTKLSPINFDFPDDDDD